VVFVELAEHLGGSGDFGRRKDAVVVGVEERKGLVSK
jgi:hypothetical protein